MKKGWLIQCIYLSLFISMGSYINIQGNYAFSKPDSIVSAQTFFMDIDNAKKIFSIDKSLLMAD